MQSTIQLWCVMNLLFLSVGYLSYDSITSFLISNEKEEIYKSESGGKIEWLLNYAHRRKTDWYISNFHAYANGKIFTPFNRDLKVRQSYRSERTNLIYFQVIYQNHAVFY